MHDLQPMYNLQLEEAFSIYNLESCYMIPNKMGFSLGRALLTFRTQADALQALHQLNKSIIDNRQIHITFAKKNNITEYEDHEYLFKQNMEEFREQYKRKCRDREHDRRYSADDFNNLNNGIHQLQQQMTGFQNEMKQQMTEFQDKMSQ